VIALPVDRHNPLLQTFDIITNVDGVPD